MSVYSDKVKPVLAKVWAAVKSSPAVFGYGVAVGAVAGWLFL